MTNMGMTISSGEGWSDKCLFCRHKTELDTYQDMFDRWIDEIRKEG
jgi:hypothetical protein